MIHLTQPAIDQKEIQAVQKILRSGHLVQGEKVAEFEKAFKATN